MIEILPQGSHFQSEFRFNMFGRPVMNLLEAFLRLLTHCPHSHVSQFNHFVWLCPLEGIIGDTSVKTNTVLIIYSNICWVVFGPAAIHNNSASARHSITAVLLLPFFMFPDGESQLHHPLFKARSDKTSTYFFFIQTASQWDILCKTRNV